MADDSEIEACFFLLRVVNMTPRSLGGFDANFWYCVCREMGVGDADNTTCCNLVQGKGKTKPCTGLLQALMVPGG